MGAVVFIYWLDALSCVVDRQADEARAAQLRLLGWHIRRAGWVVESTTLFETL